MEAIGVGIAPEDLAPEQVPHDEKRQVLGVVDALVFEREVVPAGQMADRDDHGVEDEGGDWVAEELGHPRAQRFGDDDVGGARGRAPGQVQGRGDGKEGSGHHDQDQVLDHVVPEQLAVVDADEAEDRHARREERTEPGDRFADRPRVARVQRVVALDGPEVEDQRHQDHRHRDEVELRRDELMAGQRRQGLVIEDSDTTATVLLQNVVVQLRCVVVKQGA